MPWTFDALLPEDQRYTSLKFRRVAHRFDAHRLDYADAAELCAFVLTIGGPKYARWIFRWKAKGLREIDRLLAHLANDRAVACMVEENHAALVRDDGLKCLSAMKDGGWHRGSVPGIVRMALLDMRDAGMSLARIAAAVGLTRDQVKVVCNGLWRPPIALGLAGLTASAR